MTNSTPSAYTPVSSETNRKILELEDLMIQEIKHMNDSLKNIEDSNFQYAPISKFGDIKTIVSSDLLTNPQYEANYMNIINQYNQIVSMRSDLDMKLRELYSLNNSTGIVNKSYLDTTVYKNILWTVLATSIVYFIFMKI